MPNAQNPETVDHNDSYSDTGLDVVRLTAAELAYMPLMTAMSANKNLPLDEFEVLIENTDLNIYTNEHDENLLHHAIKNRWSLPIINMIADNMGVESETKLGYTALLYACLYRKDVQLLQLLIDGHHANVRASTNTGANVLHLTVSVTPTCDISPEMISGSLAVLRKAIAARRV